MQEQDNQENEGFINCYKVQRHGRGRPIRNLRLVPTFVDEIEDFLSTDLPSKERVISPNQAGQILNLTGEAVKQWIYSNRLPATKKRNGYWLIKVADLERFIRARQEVGRRRVLIVDDQSRVEGRFAAEIMNLGHEAVFVHSKADAFLKAVELRPSLFIVNVSMKSFAAWKFIAKIRGTRRIKSIPLLILADNDLTEQETEKALLFGAQGFMRRPVSAPSLVREIERILGRTF